MKKILFILTIALGAVVFYSCGKEEALTPNPTFDESANGDNPTGDGSGNNGGGGTTGGGNTGGGNGLPADFLTDTVPSNRVALLEDFTGVRCGFCPAGHTVANGIENSLGDNFIVLAIHSSGTFSQPAPGTDWPNFETPFGKLINDEADPSGYPAGSLNRIAADNLGVTPQNPNGMAMGRNSWATAANAVVAMTSPVNIGTKATINGMDLTVVVDLYYTEDETDINHINVALVQDHLIGRQSGGTPDPLNYDNSHVLRALIAGSAPQWGDVVTETTTKGSHVRKTYTYTVPADYNGTGLDGGGAVVVDDLKVVAFVTRGKSDILTATEVDVE